MARVTQTSSCQVDNGTVGDQGSIGACPETDAQEPVRDACGGRFRHGRRGYVRHDAHRAAVHQRSQRVDKVHSNETRNVDPRQDTSGVIEEPGEGDTECTISRGRLERTESGPERLCCLRRRDCPAELKTRPTYDRAVLNACGANTASSNVEHDHC
jgi:hypothetical protein